MPKNIFFSFLVVFLSCLPLTVCTLPGQSKTIYSRLLFISQIVICCKYPKAHITVAGKIWFTQIVAAAVLTTNLAIYLTTIVRESKVCTLFISLNQGHEFPPIGDLRVCS